MTRSPLFYPLNRGGDSEAGGAADLQTDVMRFMAILSLCLVAIFALVQSMPLAPTAETDSIVDPQEVEAEKEPQHREAVAVQKPATQIKLTRPQPGKLPQRSKPVLLERPGPAPMARSESTVAEENPVDQIPVEEPVERGFSLRFETDAALTRLVAQQIVGFYAMTETETFRMNIDGANVSFWPASTPAQFHEMELTTVPDDVVRAFSRNSGAAGVKWGVTLTPDMSQSLTHFLNTEQGGALVIASNGRIDLRR